MVTRKADFVLIFKGKKNLAFQLLHNVWPLELLLLLFMFSIQAVQMPDSDVE